MRSLLQSNSLQKVGVIILVVLGFFTVSFTTYAYTYAGVLQLGSQGSQVVSLQQRLGVNPANGDFDYTTRGAVVAFQLSKGLTADGVVGPATGKALAVSIPKPTPTPTPVYTPKPTPTPPVVVYPPGCSSNIGFSVTTGKSCVTTSTTIPQYPAGCTSTNGYSITTGLRCTMPVGCTADTSYSVLTGESCDSVSTPLVYGCTSRVGYSALTGASCLTGVRVSPLQGTEGVLNHFTKTASYEGRYVPENRLNTTIASYLMSGEKGSDIRFEYMRINLDFTAGDASNKLDRYVKKIYILLGGTKVGAIDVVNFIKDGSSYDAKIDLTGAVLRSNLDTYLYISADTLENIDSGNIKNTWAVTITGVRYTDGLNRIYDDTSTGDLGADSKISFHFQPINDPNR